MKTTVMPRLVKCTNCDYTQKDFVSYYKHAKAWKANHDLEKCRAIRESKNAFDKMFADTLDSLNKLSVIK
jgi:hypothetical protein